MPIERPAKTEEIEKLKMHAKKFENDCQKINFFDNHIEVFYNYSNANEVSQIEKTPKDLDDAFYIYANMKRMNEEEFEKFKELNWREFPRNFKIFLFDYYILN